MLTICRNSLKIIRREWGTDTGPEMLIYTLLEPQIRIVKLIAATNKPNQWLVGCRCNYNFREWCGANDKRCNIR